MAVDLSGTGPKWGWCFRLSAFAQAAGTAPVHARTQLPLASGPTSPPHVPAAVVHQPLRLLLQWTWSFHDVVSIVNLVLVGSSFSS